MSDQIEFSIVDEDRSFQTHIICPVCGSRTRAVKRYDFIKRRNFFFIECLMWKSCGSRTAEFADLKTAAQVWKVAEVLTR